MYRLTNSDTIIRISDNSYIPKDEMNSDYIQFLTWCSEGNTPEPVDG